MLMNQLHCRSSSSSSVAPNIEAVLPDQQLFYLKKSGNTSISAPSTNNNPLGRFLNKLPKPTIIDGIGHTKRHSVVGDRDDEFRVDSKMVHKTSLMNNRKDSMSRSHSWIYGSLKQSSPNGRVFDEFGHSNGRDHVPSNYPYDSDICDCADSSSNKFHGASSVRLKEKSDWRNYAFNDCPQHSPIGKQSSVNCDNSVSNGKKFVGSVRKLTWKSLKQVVKKRPSLDALKKQQNPPQSVHIPPPANAPEILFVPNYYFPPAKQNFYASCTDLYEEFPPSHPTASVRVRPKPNRQPWPCEFGPLPNYHEEEGEDESEEIYHSEWDLRQFMPYDVWLAENSPPPRSNNRVMPKVKSNSHTVDNTAAKKTTESAGGQGHNKNRLSILQSEINAYELNRSDEDSSSSFDCHSNSSEDLPNHPTEQSLLPKVNGKTSQIHNRPTKQESWEAARKSTSLTNVTTISTSTTKFSGTRSTSKSSPNVPVESNRKTSNGATAAAVEKTGVSNKITSRVGASRVSHVSSSSSAPPCPSGEQVKLVQKGSATVASKKKVETDVTKKRETTEINNENVRKNALKRSKSGPIESSALQYDVVQEDESEDDDDDYDEPEQQRPIYAVKILVSQNNNGSNNIASSDYVKPILKKESVYETPNVTQVKYTGQQSSSPSLTTTVILTDDVNRNKKIVQFDQNNPTVCGGLTDDGGTESDDTLVWDDPKELIDGLDNSTKRAISQVSISCSDEGKTSSSFNDNNAHQHNRSSCSTGVNNLAEEENNHRQQPTEDKKKEEDIKMEVNKNETLRAFPDLKADRMVKMAERKTVQVRPSTIQIMNPNSLLFHDTTRIRLNQSRPSVHQAFKLEGRSKSSHGRPTKVKQSSSFRQMGSTPLRPRDPPPPPPVRQTISKTPKQGEMKGSTEKRTSSASALRESVRRLNKNGNVTSSPSSKSSTKPSVKSAESVGRNSRNEACKKPINGPTKMGDDDKNIEIVTKENSVSEIRIYSGTQNLQIDHNSQAVQVLKNYGEKQGADATTMSHNTTPSDTKSRPLSTSVILIIDDTTSTPMNPQVSAPTTYTKLQPLAVLQDSSESVSNVPQMESKDHKFADGLVQNSSDKMEPLYDDVITRTAEAVDKLVASFRESRSLSPPPLPSVPPPLPSVPPPSDSYGSSCSNMYNKIRELKSEIPDTVYDDTMSILSSNYSNSGVKGNYEEDNLPLYDDVLNLLGQDSDSGAESEGIPPPLPAQRPTLPLPKVSTDLPMLSFPLLRQQENQLHIQTSSQLGVHTFSSSDLNSNRAKDTGSPVSEDIVERTRTLLSELSQKFNSLKFATPADYATYISKVIISSSSDSSSGVEEDYGSEKNYPSSNISSNSPTTVQKESSPEPLLLARGRFLDSMKTAAAPSSLPHIAEANSCAEPVEEPIYEEIGEEDDGPIYSDAFATKSMFDGASRSEILMFLEAIRERLSTSVSDSASNSLSRSEKGAEIERNDSGIGSGSESGSLVAVNGNGGSKSTPSSSSHFICTDCNDTVDTTLAKVTATGSGSSPHYAPLGTAGDLLNQASSSASSSSNLCQTCVRKRRERKETLQEIYETEVKYGRDLRIIQEEFYNPIQIAGLLTKEQLEQIFLNVDQLCRVNTQLTGMLKSAIDDAVTTQDEDLTRVNVGKIFMEYGDTMMSAFEVYCTQQANAGALLTQLEKEKELLRIFLRVSQMENSVLRRMNLPAFLMVPVQRVTRYPLLMARLLKVTPLTHPSRAELFAAQVKIEQHLESMNKRTREASSIRLWRRISIMNGGSSSPSNRPIGITDSDDTTTRIRKMSLDVLDWSSFTDVTCVAEGCFDVVEFNGKPIRSVQACFLVRGKNLEILARKMERPVFFPPKEDMGIDAKLVLVRVKNSRFALLREPLCLSKCIISQGENDYQDYVEINEITTKNTLFLRTAETDRTAEWLRVLQCHAACAGHWRRRRGALANIMMNGMIRHL